MKICDEKIKIPMKGDFESLNVSVSTGIILYEVMKQRLS
jgi:23S rRNA (guanosine2251-2'-O)-methyltransferase